MQKGSDLGHWCVALVACFLAAAAYATTAYATGITSPVADVTGNSLPHQLFASGGLARMVIVIADPANTGAVRIGGSNVDATHGARVAPGGGLTLPPTPPDEGQPNSTNNWIDLSTVYYYAATGDKFSVLLEQ